MTNFSYRYRTLYALMRLAFFSLFLGMLWSMSKQFHQLASIQVSKLPFMFRMIPTIIAIAGGIGFLDALIKLVSPPIIKGDEQGLTVLGSWYKRHQIDWDNLDYLRYEQITTRSYSTETNRSSYRISNYLYVKPKEGRTIRVDISGIEGTVDDVLADIKGFVPDIEVRGFN